MGNLNTNIIIGILNFNNSADTKKCLSKLDELELKTNITFDVLLIDNGSERQAKVDLLNYVESSGQFDVFASAEEMSLYSLDKPGGNSFLNLSQNVGFSGGSNISLKFAVESGRYDYIWLLNNDAFPDSKALASLVDFANLNKPCITGSVIMDAGSRDVIQDLGTLVMDNIKGYKAARLKDSLNEEYIPVHSVCGASMLIDMSIVENGMYFDESFFVYGEENEFSYRCRLNNIMSYIVLKSVVYHRGAVGLGRKSPAQRYYMIRNLLYLKSKHFSRLSVYFSIIHLGISEIYRFGFDPKQIKAYLAAVYDFWVGNMGMTTREFGA